MVVRELITRLGFSLNQGQLNNAERATERVRDRAEKAAAAFRNIVTAVASIATVKAIINIGDEMQNIRTRIGQLPQTIGEAGDAFDEVAKRASASGVSITAYSSLYARVGNAAKDYIKTQEDLLGITDTISQALTVGGASAQEASAVMTQFSQALASGVLQGDEFRSMAEAAPQYLDKLSEAMGIPREQLKKMASDGKLTAKSVIEATRKMADYFSAKFKEMPLTVGRALTVISNRFAVMIDKMNRETVFITKIANLIIAGFDKIEAGINRLVAAFGGFENMMRIVGIAIGVALGAKALAILASFRAASLLALLPFLKIIAIITGVALVLEDLYVWIQGGDSLTGKLIGPWSEWSAYVLGAFNMVSDAAKWLGELLGGLAAIFAGVFTFNWNLIVEGFRGIGGQLWDTISEWAGYFWQSFSGVASAVANLIVGAFVGAFNAVAAFAMSIFDNIGKMVVGAFTLHPQLFMDGLQGYTQTLMGILPQWAQMIYRAIFDPIFSAITNAWNAAKTFLGAGEGAAPTPGAFNMVSDAVKWLGELLGGLGAIIVGALTFDWGLMTAGLAGVSSHLADTIKTWAGYFWQTVGPTVTAIATFIVDAFMGAFNMVAAFVTAIATFIVDAFMGAFNMVAAFVTGVFENIGKMVVGAFTLDPHLFMEGLKGYTQILMSILPQWAQVIYRAIFDPIVSAITNAWNAAKSFLGIGEGAAPGAAPGAGRAVGALNTLAPSMSPAQLAPSAMGAAKPNISNTTTVTVTVPPGTTAEQAAYLQKAAQQAFNKQSDDKLARDLSVYAP